MGPCRGRAYAAVLALDQGNTGPYNVVDDNPSTLRVWLSAYARRLNAPAAQMISLEQAGDEDLVYYSTRLRGASNEKVKRDMGFRPRRLEWLEDAKATESVRGA